MRTIWSASPYEVSKLSQDELKSRFIIDDLFNEGVIGLAHVVSDRIVVGGVVVGAEELCLQNPAELRAHYFCERRELAVVCLEGELTVTTDGTGHALTAGDVLYVGRGTRDVSFAGPGAVAYLVSSAAQVEHPTRLIPRDAQRADTVGEAARANLRTIRKPIVEGGDAPACTLSLGVTTLHTGSVWNTMPPHTHDRRTEVYLYDGLGDDVVVHLMGEPSSTRSLVVRDRQVVYSPSWSVHCGAGTGAYSFVWATAGENRGWDDMDHLDLADLG